jgi:hypothetical protein
MNIDYNIIKSILCFISVLALHKYDNWRLKNKLKKGPLDNFDKMVKPIQDFGLKIMLSLLGLSFLFKAFI